MLIDFFYMLKFNIGCNKICSLWNHIVDFVAYYSYWIYCNISKPQKGTDDDSDVIVSLTSFPPRFDKLYLVIRSLLAQKTKPKKIILFLYRDECVNELPKKVLDLCLYGLEICFVDINLRAHKKLYYAKSIYNNLKIITVDDDNIYPTTVVSNLVSCHKRYPNSVCCIIAHKITYKDGMINPYNEWMGGAIDMAGESMSYVAIGLGGVLYPPDCFYSDYANISLIQKLSLSADDLWNKYMEALKGVTVAKYKKTSKIPIKIRGSQVVALGKENNGAGKNDEIIKKLSDYYGTDWLR